jgi:hypothetical protein
MEKLPRDADGEKCFLSEPIANSQQSPTRFYATILPGSIAVDRAGVEGGGLTGSASAAFPALKMRNFSVIHGY